MYSETGNAHIYFRNSQLSCRNATSYMFFSADPLELLEPRTSNMVMFARKLAVPFSEILRFHLKDNIKLHKLLFKWIARW